jgi:hypothetical protein
MTSLASGAVTLCHVRVHDARSEALAERRRFERSIQGADWAPPGPLPGAILLIRRLRLAGGRTGAQTLGERVPRALRELAAYAHRPWLQGDRSDAPAIVFADASELAACFVRDWLRGLARQRWWWQVVLAESTAGAWMQRELLARPEQLAPALALLSEGGLALPWVSRLEPRVCTSAADALLRAHGLAPGDRSVPLAVTAGRAAPPPGPPGDDGTPAAAGAEEPALQRLLQEVPELMDGTLGPAQRQLLAVALVLARRPRWARTPAFTIAFEALRRLPSGEGRDVVTRLLRPVSASEAPEHGPASQGAPAPEPGPILPRERASPGSADTAAPVPSPPPVGRPGPHPSRPVGAARVAARPPPAPRSDEGAPAAPPAIAPMPGLPATDPAAPVPEPPLAMTALVDSRPAEPGVHAAAARATPLRRAATDPRIPTRYGGLFYLLNAALAMGLYGDFTQPLARTLALSPWDWLALVGRDWFGDDLVDDPLWALLAEIAGRHDGEEPGRDLEPPSQRRAKQPVDALELRLARAVGLPAGDELRALVCRHRAGVALRPGTVHVFLSLDELPLAIRIAGLDRDPGWIPAAGRDVRFFFA